MFIEKSRSANSIGLEDLAQPKPCQERLFVPKVRPPSTVFVALRTTDQPQIGGFAHLGEKRSVLRDVIVGLLVSKRNQELDELLRGPWHFRSCRRADRTPLQGLPAYIDISKTVSLGHSPLTRTLTNSTPKPPTGLNTEASPCAFAELE